MSEQDSMTTREMSPVMNGDEKGTFIQMFYGAILQPHASAEAGKDVYKEEEFIKIFFAGNNQTTVERQMTEHDKMRFSAQRALWKSNAQDINLGTPLEKMKSLNLAVIADLKRLNIFTVEALADLSSQGCQTLGMGANMWKQDAIKWLEAIKTQDNTPMLLNEIAELKKDKALLKQQLAEVSSLLEQARAQQGLPPPPSEAAPKAKARA